MAGNTIEAKLRIAAEVAQAIAALQQVKAELLATGKAAGTAAAQTGRSSSTGTDEAVKQINRRTKAEREALAETKRIEKERLAAQKAAAKEAAAAAAAAAKSEREAAAKKRRDEATAAAAASREARRRTYQTAALQPQLTDIAVGLATGQSPITVALQQGGQLRDLYGSVGGALRALLSVLTPMRVLVGGVAAGFATLAYQIAAGDRESSQLRKTLALTGNAAGTSLGQINRLATEISTEQGASIGFVRETLAELLNVAGQTDSTLQSTASAAAAIAKLNGQSAAEVVKGFEDQSAGITKWAINANKAYNFLTAQQVAYVRSLEREGRVAEAVRFVNEQLADSLKQRGAPAIGIIERAWNAAGRAVGFFFEQIKALGRDTTAEDRLKSLTQQLAEIDARLSQPVTAGRRKSVDIAERARLVEEMQALNREAARKAEDPIRMREEQERMNRDGAEGRAAQAAQISADAQRKLAKLNATLDAERDAVEQHYAQQLISASDQALKLNFIDLQRARGAREAAEEEIRAEEVRKSGLSSKAEVAASVTTLTQLEARLLEAKARVGSATAEGTRLIDQEVQRLNEDTRQRVAELQQVTVASNVADPAERARRTARAATADARREVEVLERELASAIETAKRFSGGDQVVAAVDAKLNAARASVAEALRAAELQSLAAQQEEQLQALDIVEAQIDQAVLRGALTTEAAEQRKFEARDKTAEQLKAILELQEKLAQSPAERNALAQGKLTLAELMDRTTELQRTLKTSVGTGFATLFNDIATGSKTALDAVKDFVRGVAQSMLNLITKRLGEQLVNSLFGSGAGGASTGTTGFGTFLSSLFATVRHSGGVINGLGSAARAVSPLVFAGAQILHSGGIAGATSLGLASNEVPAILQRGEEVLTANDPRHRNNYGGGPLIGNVNITVSLDGGGAGDVTTEEARQLGAGLKTAVAQYVAEQMRPGGLLAGMRRG
jgi:phage-related minor tail protein